MATEGFFGQYGFYEAIDYTPARLPQGQTRAIVRSFMAHHQSMSLLASLMRFWISQCKEGSWPIPTFVLVEHLLRERMPETEPIICNEG